MVPGSHREQWIKNGLKGEAAELSVKPIHLRVESQSNPLGIDIRIPRYSWVLQSDRRGVRQTAYQVVVADSLQELEGSGTILWDSGRIDSDCSTGIEYRGPLLRSRQRYWWRVKVWDEIGGASEWSESSFWEMGLLETSDWSAKWIEPEQRPVARDPDLGLQEALMSDEPTDTAKLHPCPLLRRTFTVKQGVRQARMYATAHGVYRMEINGARVGDQELAPEFTSYGRYLQYQTYDVAPLLVPGENVIGAILGDGWYAGRIGLIGTSCQYGDKLGLLLQLEIEYENGDKDVIRSDESFVSSSGHLVYSDLFIGEKIDARRRPDGWSRIGFDASTWLPVQIAQYGYDNLVAQYGEPIRVVQELPAIDVLTTPAGETVIDFGQVVAGRIRMRVQGEAGTEIKLEHSETLDENGNFLNNIMGRHKDQTDIYIVCGGEEELFEPNFSFHGFRYVRVTGYPGTVRAEFFTVQVLCSDMARSGSFECSDPRLNRLQDNIRWSQIGNMISIPTDCPQRERAGWTGDIQVFAPTACFNMDVDAFLSRWMRNLRVDQAENGEVPNIVPYHDSNRRADAGLGGKISSAGWGDAVTIVPWVLYQAYGNRKVLEDNYGAMKRWLSFVEKCAREELPPNIGQLNEERRERHRYLWNTGFHFGDWLLPSVAGGKDGGPPNPIRSALATKELVATSFFAYSTELLSIIAAELGYRVDADHYKQLNARIKESYAAEYLQDDGRLPAHYQGIYVLALRFELVPESMRHKVFGQLVELIEQNGYRLDTGFVSVPFLLDVLYDNGRTDLAYRLLYQTESPSWLYEVEKGATTIWEAWDAVKPDGRVARMSFNHYAFGCVGDWMYRRIAGIRPLAPGYRRLEIRPGLESGLRYATAEYESVKGTIRSSWGLEENGYYLHVRIPANATATVILPFSAESEVMESGRAFEKIQGLHRQAVRNQDILELGSGDYQFRILNR